MAEKQNIKDWALQDRPRERLMALGERALQEPELLAILIGSGNADETAVELMRRVYTDCGCNLRQLGLMSIEELTSRYKGLGPAKAVTIKAACELGRRRQEQDAKEKPKVTGSDDIFAYFQPKIGELDVEECHVLLLNQNLRIIGSQMISRGGIAGATVDVRIVLKHALLAQAPAIALAHNHPSGNASPSRDDDHLTRKLAEAARTMDIRLIDHLIITENSYYSYNNEGKI